MLARPAGHLLAAKAGGAAASDGQPRGDGIQSRPAVPQIGAQGVLVVRSVAYPVGPYTVIISLFYQDMVDERVCLR